jgi:hypothetical protein
MGNGAKVRAISEIRCRVGSRLPSVGARFGGGSNLGPVARWTHDQATVLKSAPPSWGSGRGSYLCGGGAEFHNNDPAPR